MKNALIVVGIGAIILGGGWYLLAGNKDASMMEGDQMMNPPAGGDSAMVEKTDGAMMDGDSVAKDDRAMMEGDSMMHKGSYEAYAESKLARANHGDVVLFFRASWCPTCKALDANIKSNISAIPDGLTILDVDYDNSQPLKQKYGVTYQHTLVQVDSKGNLIKKWSGSPTLAALVAEVR
jgi:thioredoxin 1